MFNIYVYIYKFLFIYKIYKNDSMDWQDYQPEI